MNIRQSHISLAILVLVALSSQGCSVAEEKRLLYRQSEIIAPLKIPAGMQQPRGQEVFAVPQVEALEALDITPPVNLPDDLLAPQDPDQVK